MVFLISKKIIDNRKIMIYFSISIPIIPSKGKQEFKVAFPSGSYYLYVMSEQLDNRFQKGCYSEFVIFENNINCSSHKPLLIEVKKGETCFRD